MRCPLACLFVGAATIFLVSLLSYCVFAPFSFGFFGPFSFPQSFSPQFGGRTYTLKQLKPDVFNWEAKQGGKRIQSDKIRVIVEGKAGEAVPWGHNIDALYLEAFKRDFIPKVSAEAVQHPRLTQFFAQQVEEMKKTLKMQESTNLYYGNHSLHVLLLFH